MASPDPAGISPAFDSGQLLGEVFDTLVHISRAREAETAVAEEGRSGSRFTWPRSSRLVATKVAMSVR
jgi:hypothetical protein